MQHIYEMTTASETQYVIFAKEDTDQVDEVFDNIGEAAAYAVTRGHFLVHTAAGWEADQQEG
jgi:hypothetical protein